MNRFRYGKPNYLLKKQKGEYNMKKLQILNSRKNPKTRKGHKTKLTKIIIFLFLIIGAIALFASVIYFSSILAFIGLGLVFWGAILTYIQPEQYTKKAILNATIYPPAAMLNQIIIELNYKGKATYLPPKYLKNPEDNKVYIPKDEDGKLPTPEHVLNQESHIILKNPQGILLTPLGSQLSQLFEKRLNMLFSKADLKYVIQNIPELLVEDLEIAENIEIKTNDNEIKIKIANSTFKDAHKESNTLSTSYPSLGCPISSAIACALTKATGKPVTIENIQKSEDSKNIQVTYLIQGKIETEAYLPEIKPEKLLTEPIQLQIRNLFPYLVSLLLTAIGSIILAQVAGVTYYDMTMWGKDVAQIFLSSRTGQAISLGMGLKIIHYFILGLASFLTGITTYLIRRSKG